MSNLLYILAGTYLMAMGLTAKTFLDGPDVAASEDDRLRARARPVKRLLVVALGLLVLVYGTYRLARLHPWS